MLEFLRNSKIMVVVAHPDDELLGLGGTLNRLVTEYGAKIHVVILGEGITSRSNLRDPKDWERELQVHKQNIKNAQRFIGYHSVSVYDFPDNRFDTIALLDIIKIIEKEKQQFQPKVIFTHHGGDVNIDHQRTFESVITSCRPLENEYVQAIITFETPSGTEWRASTDPRHFIPNLFVEISEANLQCKIDAMECYEFEKRRYPHPRSPESLRIYSQRWGVTVGKKYTEAFSIVRLIN